MKSIVKLTALVAVLGSFCVPISAFAASWLVSGTMSASLSTLPSPPEGPITTLKVYIVVSDAEGAPVTGLKAGNFVADVLHSGGQVIWSGTTLEKTGNEIDYTEQQPGEYVVYFKTSNIPVANIRGVALKVHTTIAPQLVPQGASGIVPKAFVYIARTP